MLKTAGKPAVSGILCLLPSRVYHFSSYLHRKVAPSSRPQGGNVPLSLGVWGKKIKKTFSQSGGKKYTGTVLATQLFQSFENCNFKNLENVK